MSKQRITENNVSDTTQLTLINGIIIQFDNENKTNGLSNRINNN